MIVLKPLTKPIRINLAMSQFGKLTAIKPMGVDKHNKIHWLCQCECGKQTIIVSNNLRKGVTESCGCNKGGAFIGNSYGRIHSREESTWKKLWGVHKSTSHRRGLTPMSFEDWQSQLVNHPSCWYCGAPPAERTYRFGDTVYAHGIDRIDSSVGYTPGNYRTCCTQCNIAKMDYSEQDFIDMCKRVASIHS